MIFSHPTLPAKKISIIFFYIFRLGGPGVRKKYEALVDEMCDHPSEISVVSIETAAQSRVRLLLGYLLSFLSLFSFSYLNSKKTYLYIRSNIYLGSLLSVIFFFRLNNFLPKILLEIPTPLRSLRNELKSKSKIQRLMISLCYYAACNSDILVLFSKDEMYFRSNYLVDYNAPFHFFLGNWSTFSPQLIPYTPPGLSGYSVRGRKIKLVLMANLAFWHGADLLLDSIKSADLASCFEVHIISNKNATLAHLKEEYINYYKMDFVHIHENLSRDSICLLMQQFDVGIGVLGSHRKNLYSATPIKHRDYMIFGMPVIFSGNDFDLNVEQNSVFELKSCFSDKEVLDRLESLLHMISSPTFSFPDKNHFKEYARCNLTVQVKTTKLINCLLHHSSR